ncbi:hypothetical protein BH10CYA1_BH10CYA1_58370 [soil metagenome]
MTKSTQIKLLLLAFTSSFLGLVQFVSAAPDVTNLVTKAEVEEALGAKVSSTVKELAAPLGGNQITYTSSGLPVKTFALTVRTDESLAPGMKASGYSVTKLYQQGKTTLGAGSEALTIKGGEGYSTMSRSEVLKKSTLLSATTLFGTSKAAAALRNKLLLKAADRI